MTDTQLVQMLQALPAQRVAVENLENALSLLTPEERMIAHMLLIYPQRNNVLALCRKLSVEQATVYRRRKQVLNKLRAAISLPLGEGGKNL